MASPIHSCSEGRNPHRTSLGSVEVLTTVSGRDVEYVEAGDAGGRPALYFHGTPATAGSAVRLDDVARRYGVRLLGVSRPGYGRSTTAAPGLLSVAEDVGELVRDRQIEMFAVLGVSGGGPFALAAARSRA